MAEGEKSVRCVKYVPDLPPGLKIFRWRKKKSFELWKK